MAGWADASWIQVRTRFFAGTWRSGPCLDKVLCQSGIFFDELWGLWVNMKQQMPAQQRRRSWLDQRSDKLSLPAGRSGVILDNMPKLRKFYPDKNGDCREILGSNIYGNHPGS